MVELVLLCFIPVLVKPYCLANFAIVGLYRAFKSFESWISLSANEIWPPFLQLVID